MNPLAPLRASLQSTPTMRPRPAALREKRSIAAASVAQGSHQLAQNTMRDGRPPAPESRLASVVEEPTSCSRGNAGAARPFAVEPLEASPSTARTAIAAAPARAQARALTRLTPTAGSAGREQRDVVRDVARLEVRGVDREALAGAGDAVDQPGVVDALGLLNIAFRAHPPGLPDGGEFLRGAHEVLHPTGHLMAGEEGREGFAGVALGIDGHRDHLHFGGLGGTHQILRDAQVGGDQRADVGAVRVEEGDEDGLAAIAVEVDLFAEVVVQRQRRRGPYRRERALGREVGL